MSLIDHLNRRTAHTALRVAKLLHMTESLQRCVYLAALIGPAPAPERTSDLEERYHGRQFWPRISMTFGDGSLLSTTRLILHYYDRLAAGIPLPAEASNLNQRTNELRSLVLAARILEMCNGLNAALEMTDCCEPGDTLPLDLFLNDSIAPGTRISVALRHLTRTRYVTHDHTLPLLARAAKSISTLPSEPSVEQIRSIAAGDSVVAALVLRAANSAYYGSRYKIQDLTQAVLRLGTTVGRRVLMSALLLRVCASAPLKQIWTHSHRVATMASKFSLVADFDPEVAFTAGLLHHIGSLALQMSSSEALSCAAEWKSMGFSDSASELLSFEKDHTVLGSKILEDWGIAASLVEAVRYHHRPEMADGRLASLLYLSHLRCSPDVCGESVDRIALASSRLGVPHTIDLKTQDVDIVLDAIAA